eukprot:Hpha_TRINITY_DN34925_c0_g1::TRINITY_DN34925_c0_g1_i1::g.184140::m.184140
MPRAMRGPARRRPVLTCVVVVGTATFLLTAAARLACWAFGDHVDHREAPVTAPVQAKAEPKPSDSVAVPKPKQGTQSTLVPLCWPPAVAEDTPPCQWWNAAGWTCPASGASSGGGGGSGEGCAASVSWKGLLSTSPSATIWIFGDGLMHQQFGLIACAAAQEGVTRRQWLTHTPSRIGEGGSNPVPAAKGRYRSRLPLFKDPLFMFQAYLNYARHGIVGELRPNSEWNWGVADGGLMKGLELGGGGSARMVFQMLAPTRRSASENPASALERTPLKKGDVVVIAIGAEYAQGNATLLKKHQEDAREWLHRKGQAAGIRGSLWVEPIPQQFTEGRCSGGREEWRLGAGSCEQVGGAADVCLPRWEAAEKRAGAQLRAQGGCGSFCPRWMGAMNRQLYSGLRRILAD